MELRSPHIFYRTATTKGLQIAYREAGNPEDPKLVLLHGFPASSHQYRNLIPALGDRFHVIAPDIRDSATATCPIPRALTIRSTNSPM
jgi:pimeloyl-ACP methyl ester carboxylesterase